MQTRVKLKVKTNNKTGSDRIVSADLLLEMFAKGQKGGKVLTGNCVIYTRVSSKEQELGYSLETQKKDCEAFAKKNEYSILGQFGGTYESAKTDERKEFNRMLQFIKKSKEKISFIVVYSIDRFSRSGANGIYIKEQLKKEGIYIVAVTQPVDATTSSGDFQQNIQMIFSHYDNQLRREKCMAGVKEAISRGEWCHKAPMGYDAVHSEGKRKLVVNEKGKLLRKAFLWKAEGLTIEQIREKLVALGLNIYHQKLSQMFRNPFYCGLIAHNSLEGKLQDGNQEKLVSKAIFMKVNELLQENAQGYKVKHENEDVPMKNFLKCGHCGDSMPGYIVKRKNIWYYKCRKKGCCNNKSARQVHDTFMQEILAHMCLNPEYAEMVKQVMLRTYYQLTEATTDNTALLRQNLQVVEQKIERLEERFIIEEITADQFARFTEKFRAERDGILEELGKTEVQVSNPENYIDQIIGYSLNLPETWASASYQDKQKIQNMVFPEGIAYDKKNDQCRTSKINWVFLWIARQQQELANKKTGIPGLNLQYASLVGPVGIEPTTL
ncbi:MAG: recombinase family protein [Bacteroidia bacterium]|nr:recombinase family protein [Bacteroidia bacterium]